MPTNLIFLGLHFAISKRAYIVSVPRANGPFPEPALEFCSDLIHSASATRLCRCCLWFSLRQLVPRDVSLPYTSPAVPHPETISLSAPSQAHALTFAECCRQPECAQVPSEQITRLDRGSSAACSVPQQLPLPACDHGPVVGKSRSCFPAFLPPLRIFSTYLLVFVPGRNVPPLPVLSTLENPLPPQSPRTLYTSRASMPAAHLPYPLLFVRGPIPRLYYDSDILRSSNGARQRRASRSPSRRPSTVTSATSTIPKAAPARMPSPPAQGATRPPSTSTTSPKARRPFTSVRGKLRPC